MKKIGHFWSILTFLAFTATKVYSQNVPEIYDYSVTTKIQLRYAITEIDLKMRNMHPGTQEAVFDMTIPNEAFVSNFTMQKANEDVFVAMVKEKEEAKEIYEKSNTNAGLVQQSEEFKTGKKV